MSVTLERGGEGERLGARARWAVEIPSPHKNAANRDIPRLLPHENGLAYPKIQIRPPARIAVDSCRALTCQLKKRKVILILLSCKNLGISFQSQFIGRAYPYHTIRILACFSNIPPLGLYTGLNGLMDDCFDKIQLTLHKLTAKAPRTANAVLSLCLM